VEREGEKVVYRKVEGNRRGENAKTNILLLAECRMSLDKDAPENFETYHEAIEISINSPSVIDREAFRIELKAFVERTLQRRLKLGH
jgi:hypothetical protein